jgi:hypothetical protein
MLTFDIVKNDKITYGLYVETIRGRQIAYVSYPKIMDREHKINEFVRVHQDREDDKVARREERELYVPELVVGDIMVYRWGYDQSNVDFFQVLKVKGQRVTLQEIGGEFTEKCSGPMSAYCVPKKDFFLENAKPFMKTVQSEYIKHEHGSLHKFDGSPEYISWYA